LHQNSGSKGERVDCTSDVNSSLPLLVTLSGLLTLAAYTLGLPGGFVYDDLPNLVDNPRMAVNSLADLWPAVTTGTSGPTGRPVSLLTFGLNHLLAGGHAPLHYKLTNLALHLLTGGLLYLLLIRFARAADTAPRPDHAFLTARGVAGLAAALWLLSPLHVSTVLYTVQRMTLLAALFTVAGLLCYAHGRDRMLAGRSGWPWIGATVLLFWPLATASKENGALLLPLALAVEWLVYRWRGTAGQRRALGLGFALLLVPGGVVLAALISDPSWLISGYDLRPFTLGERLLTETRALWFYIGLTLLPDIGAMGLFHDDFPLSTGLLTPPSTLVALLGLALLATLVFVLRRKAPLTALGLAIFLIGHALESTVLPLLLVFEHRNYLPAAGLLLVVADGFNRLATRWPSPLYKALPLLLLVGLGAATALRASQWGDPLTMLEWEVTHHPTSALARHHLGDAYATAAARRDGPIQAALRTAAKEQLQQAITLAPESVATRAALLVRTAQWGELEPAAVAQLADLLRSQAVPATETAAVIKLIDCTTDTRTCEALLPYLPGLVRAATGNPRLGLRARVHAAWARHLAARHGDVDGAIAAARQATRLDPGSPDYRLILIKLLIAADRPGEVTQEVALGRRHDRLGLHSGSWNHWESRAAQMTMAK
jgi:hypothetical protein